MIASRRNLDTYFSRRETLSAPNSTQLGMCAKNKHAPIEKCIQITAQESYLDLRGNKVTIN